MLIVGKMAFFRNIQLACHEPELCYMDSELQAKQGNEVL